uniref:Bloodthirsty-related gene family, member 2 n=1 Tax=Periophthalmus magnuspinnatus TaxID=409849 RepID=A0A3B4BGX0_9GOBI
EASAPEPLHTETFLCSICLEVFSEPVTTPCGHNFCQRCTSQVWDTDGPCTCPLCKEMFHSRPQLKVNTLLKEALKSCLVCQTSFLENLEDRICPTHQRPLEIFCATDRSCVCTVCVLEHKNHEFLSLEEACERRRSSLLQTQAQSQHMVEQRRQKIQEIQILLELSETETLRERAVGLQAFTALMQSVQRRMDLFLVELQEKQSRSHRRAQDLVQRLQQEICDLEQSSADAERLSRSHDPLHFLHHCPAPTPPAGLKDVTRALSVLENSLSQEFNKQFKELASEFNKTELRRVQQCAVEVTLGPDTAHPELVLSEDLKQVHHTDVRKQLPDSPLRFDKCVNILGKQSFSSGRFYFEVQVKGKTNWDLGVAQESMNRKGNITACPEHGLWCIVLRNKDEYKACSSPPVPLSPQRAPEKVGVFVDYGKGLVSFYDAHSADLLYSFTDCCFREKLFPFFSPSLNEGGSNSAPLVLTAVETLSSDKVQK